MAETEKRTTKRTAAKQSGAKKTASRKTASKKAAPRKAAPKKAGDSKVPARKARARAEGRPRPKPLQVARRVAEQLAELTGKSPEAVTAIESTDDGWQIQLEVVESHRIPDSADLLALYEVQADSSGDLTGYRRLRRYSRGHSGDDPEVGR